MLHSPRDHQTVDCLQSLLGETFQVRDDFYAASERLSNADRRRICRWFGDQLGGQAATLQQVITASGASPRAPNSSQKAEEKFESLGDQVADDVVLCTAEQQESTLLKRYNSAIEAVEDREIEGLLRRHMRESEMADCVLRSLIHSD